MCRHKNIVWVLVILFHIYSCSTKNQKIETPKLLITIDVETAVKNMQPIHLSKVVENITYIPLETLSDNYLNTISLIQFTDSYIFISDGNKLLEFTREGKFVKQIGRIGRGPGEYRHPIHFSVNEQANIILVLGEEHLTKYDIEGNFMGTVPSIHSIEFFFYGHNRFVSYHPNYDNKPVSIIIRDEDLNPIHTFNNPSPPKVSDSYLNSAPMYTYKENLFFKENYHDTLYQVKDSVLIPHIVYNEENLRLDKNYKFSGNVDELIKQLEKVNDKLRAIKIFESSRYIFTIYKKGSWPPPREKFTLVIFDKKEKNIYSSDNQCLINDFDGGLNLTFYCSIGENTMVSWINSFEVKAHVASEAFKNSTPKYPIKKQELEQLANSLDENDNPVLMLIKLKE